MSANKLAIGVVGASLVVAGLMIGAIIQRAPESKSTVMVKAQAADAQCTEYGTHDGVEISVCTLPSSPNKDSYVSVYGRGPWQVFPLKPAPTPAAPQAAAKAPTPDAGVGSGSGSGSGQGSSTRSGSGSAKK